MSDNVNHPAHYETGRFECIEVMEETQGIEATKDFCICNALKYIYRHRNKNGTEDIKKAIWYLNKSLELEEKGHEKVEAQCSKTQYVAGGIYPAKQKGWGRKKHFFKTVERICLRRDKP